MSNTISANQKTIQEIIDSTSANANSRKTGELGKDEFLNLLVTQLRYQDPLNPMDDKEFIGQMAQFSSLEQMQNLNASFTQSRAYSLIGKDISANITDEKTKENKLVEGIVSSVKVSQGKTYAVVNGKEIPVDNIFNVTDASPSAMTNLSMHTQLIRYNAKGMVYNPKTGEVVQVQGNVTAIQKGVYEDYAIMDGIEVSIAEIVTQNPSADPDYVKNYLEANKGKEVDVVVTDADRTQKVSVKGTLKSYTVGTDGKVTAVLDDVNVPVDSILYVTRSSSDQTGK